MKSKKKEETSGNLGFEETFWKAADKLRSNRTGFEAGSGSSGKSIKAVPFL